MCIYQNAALLMKGYLLVGTFPFYYQNVVLLLYLGFKSLLFHYNYRIIIFFKKKIEKVQTFP